MNNILISGKHSTYSYQGYPNYFVFQHCFTYPWRIVEHQMDTPMPQTTNSKVWRKDLQYPVNCDLTQMRQYIYILFTVIQQIRGLQHIRHKTLKWMSCMVKLQEYKRIFKLENWCVKPHCTQIQYHEKPYTVIACNATWSYPLEYESAIIVLA